MSRALGLRPLDLTLYLHSNVTDLCPVTNGAGALLLSGTVYIPLIRPRCHSGQQLFPLCRTCHWTALSFNRSPMTSLPSPSGEFNVTNTTFLSTPLLYFFLSTAVYSDLVQLEMRVLL